MANRYRVFIDESNTPVYWNIQLHKNEERYYTLCAVIVERKEYKRLKRELKEIFEEYSPYVGDCELKSRYIRRGNPNNPKASECPYTFWKHGQKGMQDYLAFSEELKALFISAKMDVISVTCDKYFAQNKYPTHNIASTVFTDLWERIVIYHAVKEIKDSRIMLDSRYTKSDTAISSLYEYLNNNGSYYVTKKRMGEIGLQLHENILFLDSKESKGLQICDYMAYPIQKANWAGKDDPFYQEIIVPKFVGPIKDSRTGKRIQMGNKMSLSR